MESAGRFDQVLELAVRAKHLGTMSFILSTEFRVAGTDAVSVTVETVYVLVDARALKKTALPPELRTALEKGAPGVQVDHAGYLRR